MNPPRLRYNRRGRPLHLPYISRCLCCKERPGPARADRKPHWSGIGSNRGARKPLCGGRKGQPSDVVVVRCAVHGAAWPRAALGHYEKPQSTWMQWIRNGGRRRISFMTRRSIFFTGDEVFVNKRTKNGKRYSGRRGNGWVFGGLARTLPYIPPDYPSRAKYEEVFKDMAVETGFLAAGRWHVAAQSAGRRGISLFGDQRNGPGLLCVCVGDRQWAVGSRELIFRSPRKHGRH